MAAPNGSTPMNIDSAADTPQKRQPFQKKAPKSTTTLTAQAVGEMYGHKSNVFRMETDEMLAEIALNYESKRMAAVQKTLHQLKSVIDAIPERKELKVRRSVARWRLAKMLMICGIDRGGRGRDEEAQGSHTVPGPETGKGYPLPVLVPEAVVCQCRRQFRTQDAYQAEGGNVD